MSELHDRAEYRERIDARCDAIGSRRIERVRDEEAA